MASVPDTPRAKSWLVRIGAGMARMKKALVAAACLLPWPGMAMATELHPYYTLHCEKVRFFPTVAELRTKNGAMLWNGSPIDWKTMQAYLADVPNAVKQAPDGNIFITVEEAIPHQPEIVAILAKQGLTLHHCPTPGFPPVY